MARATDTLIPGEGSIVVGAGLAGLFTALKLAPSPVTVLSPMPLGEGASSAWAQGGVAAALRDDDSAEAHAADTVAAGGGTVDVTVAAAVAGEAKARIEDLIALGTPFDRDAAGALVQSREAAHSAHRVVRVRGDTAGAAIMSSLIDAVRATPSIRVIEGMAVDDLVVCGGRVTGVFARRSSDPWSAPVCFSGRAVVLATGGAGGLYNVTSNPARVLGQGLGMAARAGAEIQDPEFVQFHPTGLAVAIYPTPLASEALRGEGATLIDETGHRFMTDAHPDAELAPRDIVARAIHRHVRSGHTVFLDTREALGARLTELFPTIAQAAIAAGVDPVIEPIPVRPIQHYHMGGIRTDGRGRSSLNGLWAVGEVACTGLHGANRLASNSLLEALVYGARAADDISASIDAREAPEKLAMVPGPEADVLPGALLARLREVMSEAVGLERCGSGLRAALAEIAQIEDAAEGTSRAFLNMTTAATLIAAAALRRTESRGGHYRSDHPETEETWAVPTVMTLADALEVRAIASREAAA